MSRYLKPLALLVIGLCLVYGGYWFGVNRFATAIGTFYIDTKIQSELATTRIDGKLVRVLADGQYDTAFQIAKINYFSQVLAVVQNSEKTRDPVIQQSIKELIAEAKALRKELSYRFPTEEENKLWAQLME